VPPVNTIEFCGGGPWDGLTLDLPDGDAEEIILRRCDYWPSAPTEFVYRRVCMGDFHWRLVEGTAILADNERLRQQSKELEASRDSLIGELQRVQERIKRARERAKKKAGKKPLTKTRSKSET